MNEKKQTHLAFVAVAIILSVVGYAVSVPHLDRPARLNEAVDTLRRASQASFPALTVVVTLGPGGNYCINKPYSADKWALLVKVE